MHGMGWFSTARDQAALDLFDAVLRGIQDGRVRSEIRYVFSNGSPERHPRVNDLRDRAGSAGIPFIVLPSSKFLPKDRIRGRKDEDILRRWRIAYDREIMERLEPFRADLIVLAGYMLITGPEICSKHTMINLHPALPTGPKGSWQAVIRRLIRSNAEESGVTIHLVTERLDVGPPLTYCRFSIRGDPFRSQWEELPEVDLGSLADREIEGTRLFREIRRYGFAREVPLLLSTLERLSRRELRIRDRLLFRGSDRLSGGLDLTTEVEADLKEGSIP